MSHCALLGLLSVSLDAPARLPAAASRRAPSPACSCSIELGGLASDVLLQVTLSRLDPRAMQEWLCKRPYCAALPVQPMLWQPVDGPPLGVELTFRRKPTDEKGGANGGLRFLISRRDDRPAGEADEARSAGALLVTRMSEGQYVAKAFSEQAIVSLLLRELGRLPPEVGEVAAVLRP